MAKRSTWPSNSTSLNNEGKSIEITRCAKGENPQSIRSSRGPDWARGTRTIPPVSNSQSWPPTIGCGSSMILLVSQWKNDSVLMHITGACTAAAPCERGAVHRPNKPSRGERPRVPDEMRPCGFTRTPKGNNVLHCQIQAFSIRSLTMKPPLHMSDQSSTLFACYTR